jgi:hypothetical protein
VARLVELRHDPELSRRALLAAAPVGAALRMAGSAAAGWLAGGASMTEAEAAALLTPPEETFETAEKAIGARLRVRFAGGAEVAAEVEVPEGAAGPDTRRRHREIARGKLLRNAAPLLGEDGAAAIADRVERLPEATATEVAELANLLGAGFRGQD